MNPEARGALGLSPQPHQSIAETSRLDLSRPKTSQLPHFFFRHSLLLFCFVQKGHSPSIIRLYITQKHSKTIPETCIIHDCRTPRPRISHQIHSLPNNAPLLHLSSNSIDNALLPRPPPRARLRPPRSPPTPRASFLPAPAVAGFFRQQCKAEYARDDDVEV